MRQAALVLLSLALGTFVVGLILIGEASQYSATPDQRLAWRPEAKFNSETLERERISQREDEWLLDKYSKKVNICITSGIAATLLALMCLLLAVGVMLATMAAAAILVISIVVVIANGCGVRFRLLWPRPADYDRELPDKLTDEQRGMLR